MPRGGPSGGDGGDGGDVWVVCDSSYSQLGHLREGQSVRAQRGEHGKGSKRHGSNGESCEIPVPPGTVVRDADAGDKLADLAAAGERVRVASGGRGGRGNARFATSTNQAPRYAEPGRQGEQRVLELELKLIADVGLVGQPNAGKTTLLRRLTAAKGKVAAYPFTTLEPHLGILELPGYQRAVLADIPGLIEGAHRGEGLGLNFLRHIERTRALAVLVDAATLAGEPVEQYESLCRELGHYNPELLLRPRLVIASKMDLSPPQERLEALRRAADADAAGFCAISAVSGAGLERLVDWIAQQVAKDPAVAP